MSVTSRVPEPVSRPSDSPRNPVISQSPLPVSHLKRPRAPEALTSPEPVSATTSPADVAHRDVAAAGVEAQVARHAAGLHGPHAVAQPRLGHVLRKAHLEVGVGQDPRVAGHLDAAARRTWSRCCSRPGGSGTGARSRDSAPSARGGPSRRLRARSRMASSRAGDSAWRVAVTSAWVPLPAMTFIDPARFSTAKGRVASWVSRTVFVTSASRGRTSDAWAATARARIHRALRTVPPSDRSTLRRSGWAEGCRSCRAAGHHATVGCAGGNPPCWTNI